MLQENQNKEEKYVIVNDQNKYVNKKLGRYEVNWVDDSIKINSSSKIDINEIDMKMESRRRKMKVECNQVQSQMTDTDINSKEFVINDRFKLVWCNIFKSASSTWIYNFLLMKNISKDKINQPFITPINLLRKIYPRPTSTSVQLALEKHSFQSMIIVREPFERLLSAYFDKIQSTEQAYFETIRCRILGDFSKRKYTRPCSATFPEFVDFVIYDYTRSDLNEHWAPYYSFCSVCQVNFHYILHFENLTIEERYLTLKVSSHIKHRIMLLNRIIHILPCFSFFFRIRLEII